MVAGGNRTRQHGRHEESVGGTQIKDTPTFGKQKTKARSYGGPQTDQETLVVRPTWQRETEREG